MEHKTAETRNSLKYGQGSWITIKTALKGRNLLSPDRKVWVREKNTIEPRSGDTY